MKDRNIFQWLEGDSHQVKAWVKAEAETATVSLSALPGRDAIADRLRQLSYFDLDGIPRRFGDRIFFSRLQANLEKRVIYVREGSAERVLLDPNTWSKDGHVSLGRVEPSPDGRKIAFLVRKNASDESTLKVLDVETGHIIDTLSGTRYGVPTWAPTSNGLYYSWVPPVGTVPENERIGRIEYRFHRLGADPSEDKRIFAPTGNPERFMNCSVSEDGRFLFLQIEEGWARNDLFLRESFDNAPLHRLGSGSDLYHADSCGGFIFVVTNEGAPRWRVFRVDPEFPSRENWLEVVPESESTLDSWRFVGGKMLLSYMDRAIHRLEIRSLDGALLHKVTLPGVGHVGELSGRQGDADAYCQLNVYAHIWKGLRGRQLDKVAVIATRPTRPLYRALRAGEATKIQAAMEAWNPVLEVPVDGNVVAEVMESFGRVVDLIEDRRFSPPGLEVLKAPSRPDGKVPFAQDVCLNCDARFGCASYRQLVRAQSPGRADQALRDASADFGGDAEKQDWRDSGVTATARIDVEDEGTSA